MPNFKVFAKAKSREERFNSLVDQYHKPLYRYALWLGNGCSDIAEDLVQETFMKAWRGFDGLRNHAAAKSWLTTILRRESVRRFHSGEPLRSELDPDQLPDHQGSSGELSFQTERLHRAILKLKPIYREPLLLQLIFGYTQEEIAALLELPANTVATRLRRARIQLQEALEQPEQGESRSGCHD